MAPVSLVAPFSLVALVGLVAHASLGLGLRLGFGTLKNPSITPLSSVYMGDKLFFPLSFLGYIDLCARLRSVLPSNPAARARNRDLLVKQPFFLCPHMLTL